MRSGVSAYTIACGTSNVEFCRFVSKPYYSMQVNPAPTSA